MTKKGHMQNVTINDRRRDNKKTNDLISKGTGKQTMNTIFDKYYRDQVRALYRTVLGGK